MLKKLTLSWIQAQFMNSKFALSLCHTIEYINISDVSICRQMTAKALIRKNQIEITLVNICIRRKAVSKQSTYDQM